MIARLVVFLILTLANATNESILTEGAFSPAIAFILPYWDFSDTGIVHEAGEPSAEGLTTYQLYSVPLTRDSAKVPLKVEVDGSESVNFPSSTNPFEPPCQT